MRSISLLERFAESTRAAVTRGLSRTSGGHLHSSETATSESINPMSATISVALGSSEQTRVTQSGWHPARRRQAPARSRLQAERLRDDVLLDLRRASVDRGDDGRAQVTLHRGL